MLVIYRPTLYLSKTVEISRIENINNANNNNTQGYNNNDHDTIQYNTIQYNIRLLQP